MHVNVSDLHAYCKVLRRTEKPPRSRRGQLAFAAVPTEHWRLVEPMWVAAISATLGSVFRRGWVGGHRPWSESGAGF